jgi:hypothetical protein
VKERQQMLEAEVKDAWKKMALPTSLLLPVTGLFNENVYRSSQSTANGVYCTRSLWMTRLKTAWGIRRTRYLRLCNCSGDPKSTTPGSSANNLVIVSLLTLRNFGGFRHRVKLFFHCRSVTFTLHCRDSRHGQSSSY